jgi:hypothetical protein
MNKNACRTLIGAAFAITAIAVACSDSSTGPGVSRELDGPDVTIGDGDAHTYAIANNDGVRSLGIVMSDAALTGLPDTLAQWNLALPSGTMPHPWDHAMINWNPHGHEPVAIYGAPHFDFHFYTIPLSEQMTIPGGPDATPVPAANMPQDYASQVISVPMMGVHWADTLASEFHGRPFDKTFIYGFSNGKMDFVEPMITAAFLKSRTGGTADIKQPAKFQAPGAYPTSYSVQYDASRKSTLISLDSLVEH